uniref:G-protein coupled receptors family 3 profile domain-containing protein n=1 Tax=Xenopus tropicalis TaxID=8364 RepID=A0A1B8Y6R2_XENTR
MLHNFHSTFQKEKKDLSAYLVRVEQGLRLLVSRSSEIDSLRIHQMRRGTLYSDPVAVTIRAYYQDTLTPGYVALMERVQREEADAYVRVKRSSTQGHAEKSPADAKLLEETKRLCKDPQKFRYLVEFLFLVKELNDNPSRLPNVTLGYHIHDSCGASQRALMNISYGATDPSLSDRVTFPYVYRTVQSDEEEYIALCKLLKYFGWNWIGILRSDDYSGYKDHQLLIKYLSREGICVAFTISVWEKLPIGELKNKINKFYSASVIIICGDVGSSTLQLTRPELNDLRGKTFTFLSKWLNQVDVLSYFVSKLLHGSLLFMQKRRNDQFVPRFKEFSDSYKPSNYPEDNLLENIWMWKFSCLSKDKSKNEHHQFMFRFLHNCSGKEKLTDLPSYLVPYHSASLMNAVEIMFVALTHMQNSLPKQTSQYRHMYNYQLHRYLKNVSYTSDGSPALSFTEKRDFIYEYEIVNPQLGSDKTWTWNTVGSYVPWAQRLTLTQEKIRWKTPNNKLPISWCSERCVPGYRKVSRPGIYMCCYDCVWCPEGEISNTTDSENCIQCPKMEWPNRKKTKCIPKTVDFLSYTHILSAFFSATSALFFLASLLILGVFIAHRETPIVRANNRSLSFLLLVSIKLSFLSVFLFLGRPVDITCMLRIITFGITFSIAVSSLLAKTIMVCVAFKATKPGSSWRKWLGVKLSNSVVLFCSSIQIIICMTWLAISPPFQELDIHTSPGTIIIQCNEGSAIGFYSVIGYMGLLAAVSFVLAFLARSLPDSFNEAKYITFSMLLFCSVWITMIPAYLSTKGKNTVCVEIFAILTSSAGLLACIFLPKCYIIQFRSEINTKSQLLGNRQNQY